MSLQNEERRPAQDAASNLNRTADSTLPLDHALLLTRTIRGGGVRRRVLFSLPSAQAAVVRAESAGHTATITLVRLQPVGHVVLADLDVDVDVHDGGGQR